MKFEFFVPGIPRPQGSKRAFVHPKTGRAVMVEANAATKPWRQDIAAIALQERPAAWPRDDRDMALRATFYFPRPQSHRLRSGALKAAAPKRPGVKPDIDKLARALCDALTGIAFADDSRIVTLTAEKRYVDDLLPPGVEVALVAL